MNLSPEEMGELFSQTRIVKRPTYGIIKGYHELPYICLGDSDGLGFKTVEVRGKVHVSPRFIIRPSQYEPSYAEMFGEDNVDTALAGRVFGFMGFRGSPVECKSEYLKIRHVDSNIDRVLSEVLDELERHEDITTGVFITPDARYYPVSVERFLSSIVEDEFSI